MIRQLMAKLKVVHKWVELGRVQSFMLTLGRVGSGRVGSLHLWVGLGRRPTLHYRRDTYSHYNKSIGGDTKAAARQSTNCIKKQTIHNKI